VAVIWWLNRSLMTALSGRPPGSASLDPRQAL